MQIESDAQFVAWFRSVAPYFHAFRGRTFVVAFGGEVVAQGKFIRLAHDINLLHSAGIRLVLVHGSRPQIEAQLKARKTRSRYKNGVRVTDPVALECVKEAVGVLRVEIEALLSMGLPNSPMAGAELRVASGNFVIARPVGVRDGVDFQHTGEVRRIDASGIREVLDLGKMVMLSAVGYSPTGEIFNLRSEDVATQTAIALKADKLVLLGEGDCRAALDGALIRQLTSEETRQLLDQGPLENDQIRPDLEAAVAACDQGVERAH